tara:strand:- start:884 stop:1363 length:480 start_codon:yes stop_codon:yes gene_type:complete
VDFPKKGIIFRDALGILQEPKIFNELIEKMSSSELFNNAEAIISVDARGFIFGSALSFKTLKPMIVARKPNKLPGQLLKRSYDMEYGKNTLSIQREALNKYKTFVIVDDLLATGGTVNCIYEMVNELGKKITGLSVVIELQKLSGRKKLSFEVDSQIIY